MTAALHVKHEPAEADAPLNEALAGWESMTRFLLAEGGEAALRARLARLLPAEPAPAATAAAPAFAPDPLEVTKVVAVCRTLASFKLTAEKHASIAHLREICLAYLEAANGEGTP